jgi:hypothetical protein
MRRIFSGAALCVAIVLGSAAQAEAKPKPPPRPAGCTAASPGAHVGEGDFASYAPNMTDPGLSVNGIVITPPTYNGGDFNFTLPLQGASCTNGAYTVFVSREDTGETLAFTARGDTSNPIDLTHGAQRIFDGYNAGCVRAHVTTSINGQLVQVGRVNEMCGNGGGGRTWG